MIEAWHQLVEFFESNKQPIMFGLGIPIVGFSLMQLFSASNSNKKQPNKVVSLEKISKDLWASNTNINKRIVLISDLVRYWRKPQGYLSDNYIFKAKNPKIRDFFHECVIQAYWFQDQNKMYHKAVIIQILELLDCYTKAPSVVRNQAYKSDSDHRWNDKYCATLAKVALYEHLINACELGIAHLIETKQQYRIPDAMVAILAHDIGKLPGLDKEHYATGEHPVCSQKLLQLMQYFDHIPRSKEIGDAVVGHHNETAKPHSLTMVVMKADKAARKAEFNALDKKMEPPSWIKDVAIPDRKLVYPGLQGLVDEERDIFALGGSGGVMGDMTNLSDLIARGKKREAEASEDKFSAEEIKRPKKTTVNSDSEKLDFAEKANEEHHETETSSDDDIETEGFLDEGSAPSHGQTATPSPNKPVPALAPPQDATLPEAPAEDLLGINDPKWDMAVELVNSTDDAVFDIQFFRQHLVVGRARAEAILADLINAKILYVPTEEKSVKEAFDHTTTSSPEQTATPPSENLEEVINGQEEKLVLAADQPQCEQDPCSEAPDIEGSHHDQPEHDKDSFADVPESEEDESPPPQDMSSVPLPEEEGDLEPESETETATDESPDGPQNLLNRFAEAAKDEARQQTRTVHDKPVANIDDDTMRNRVIEIGKWFDPSKLVRQLRESIDRSYRWSETDFPPKLEDVTGQNKAGPSQVFIYSSREGIAWVSPFCIRKFAALQMINTNRELARDLFYEGGDIDKEYQNAIINSVVTYFQQTGSIRTDILPEDSPFYAVPCTFFAYDKTEIGSKRLIPFRLFNDFYNNWDEAEKRRAKNPKLPHSISFAKPKEKAA